MTDESLQPLSCAETEILRIVWGLGSGTVQDVCDGLPRQRRIAYATVQTLLRRLEKKGYVAHDAQGKAHVFKPVALKEQVIRSAVGAFIQRLFGGDAVPLVMHLAKARKLTLEDVERLKRIIEEEQG